MRSSQCGRVECKDGFEKKFKMGARDEMEAQRGARPTPLQLAMQRVPLQVVLQQARSTHAGDGIGDWLATENPASYRKAHRNVTQMHDFHSCP
jgi:hypothetical protein